MFAPNQVFAVLDYETFSEANLKKVGSYEYANHPSTEVLCVSWRVGTLATIEKAPVKSYAPLRPWNKHRDDLRTGAQLKKIIEDPSIIIVAHNSLFEQAITRFVLSKHLAKLLNIKGPWVIPPSRFFCTRALASIYALPASLDGATAALGLDHQKDKEGHRLMLRWSKPKKPSKKDPSTRYTKNFDRLVEYCEHDIYAETDLLLELPPMIPFERDLWIFDQEINFRGITVDRDLVQKVLVMIQQEKKTLTKKLQKLTEGEVQTGGQGAKILAWLESKGVSLPDLRAKTVEDAIKDGLVTGVEKEVLEIRQLLNKTSLKKYPNFLNHTATDGRMRFSMNYHAASTGRFGGAGVQPHNFPRGSLKYKDQEGKEHDLAPFAAELIKDGADLELVRSLFGVPIEVFVSCLRTMITATEGHQLYVADYAAIEARILFWVADHIEGCRAFAEGRKMYEEMAMEIFAVRDILKITKDQRFVGKQTILGSGYGMGWKKFQKSCLDLGQEVPTHVSKKAISTYREVNAPVPKLWKNLEQAAISAVQNPKKVYAINHTKWFMKGKFLYCELPSGRCLHYYGPRIKFEKMPWGETKGVLYHWGVDSKTKKWKEQKTWGGTLTENVVQAISRDLLVRAMIRQEKADYKILLTVHDEIIAERPEGTGDVEEFNKLMSKLPVWAKGAPVAVEGWTGFRYRK